MRLLILLIISYILRVVTTIFSVIILKRRILGPYQEFTVFLIFIANVAYMIGSITNGINRGREYIISLPSSFLVISSVLQGIAFLCVIIWLYYGNSQLGK